MNAAMEKGDMMEAANATELSDSEPAVRMADTVDPGMEGVCTAVSASVSAAVTAARRRDGRGESCRNNCAGHTTAGAVFRNMVCLLCRPSTLGKANAVG